jgi:hypothetical protein
VIGKCLEALLYWIGNEYIHQENLMTTMLSLYRTISPFTLLGHASAIVARIASSSAFRSDAKKPATPIRHAAPKVAGGSRPDDLIRLYRLARGSDSLSYSLAQELERRAQRYQ